MKAPVAWPRDVWGRPPANAAPTAWVEFWEGMARAFADGAAFQRAEALRLPQPRSAIETRLVLAFEFDRKQDEALGHAHAARLVAR